MCLAPCVPRGQRQYRGKVKREIMPCALAWGSCYSNQDIILATPKVKVRENDTFRKITKGGGGLRGSSLYLMLNRRDGTQRLPGPVLCSTLLVSPPCFQTTDLIPALHWLVLFPTPLISLAERSSQCF